MFHLLREIAPVEAMAVVFSDGVHSEGVTVFPDGSEDLFRLEEREKIFFY